MFEGCGTALVTPFTADGSLDEATFRKLVQRQVTGGIGYLVPCGTTGESPTLNQREHLRVVEIALEEKGDRKVVAGCGGYDTAHVIHLAKELEGMGVDALLSVTPYYNKPSQEGLVAHYEALAAATSLPIVLYSVQPRTNVNIEPATVATLAQIPNIVAIKEASGSLAQVASILARVPSDFEVLSGDDITALPLIAMGGRGVISVVSNVIPGQWQAMATACLAGDFAKARELVAKYTSLIEACFWETNPQPVKFMLEAMETLQANFRLPLVRPRNETQVKLLAELKAQGLVG